MGGGHNPRGSRGNAHDTTGVVARILALRAERAVLVARLDAARTFNEGFATTEYLAAALLDLAWHQLTPAQTAAVTDVLAFEAQALADAGVDFPAVWFREQLLSRGGSVDSMRAFRTFRGRDPQIEPLLARRGLSDMRHSS